MNVLEKLPELLRSMGVSLVRGEWKKAAKEETAAEKTDDEGNAINMEELVRKLIKDEIVKLSAQTQIHQKTDRTQIEKDVYDLIGDKKKDDAPVILNMESINISEPGTYELDLVHIFKGQPLVYKVEEGKNMIDLPSTFLQKKNEK